MRAILTGLNGTVAPVMARHLQGEGHQVIGWDRRRIPVDDETMISEFLEGHQPEWFFHFATGSPEWSEQIAKTCHTLKIKLIFTSSVSVFSSSQQGPFKVNELPKPDDDYGHYKFHCETVIRKVNPEAIIARLGWQIGDAPGSNTMIDYLHQLDTRQGQIEASRNWFPACAFLEDTAASLYQLMKNFPTGLYHLDANPGLHFYDIVKNITHLQQRKWRIIPAIDPVINNRLLDDRIKVKSIVEHFKES